MDSRKCSRGKYKKFSHVPNLGRISERMFAKLSKSIKMHEIWIAKSAAEGETKELFYRQQIQVKSKRFFAKQSKLIKGMEYGQKKMQFYNKQLVFIILNFIFICVFSFFICLIISFFQYAFSLQALKSFKDWNFKRIASCQCGGTTTSNLLSVNDVQDVPKIKSLTAFCLAVFYCF